MAYKRTGRPPGRPKTKWYVTIMTRVPEDLADQAKRYAAMHRQTVSDVLREGLLLLLQEQDTYRPFLSDTHTVQEIVSDVNSSHKAGAQEIVSDRNMREEIVSDVNSLHDMRKPEIVSDMNRWQDIASDTHGVAAPVPDTRETLSPLDEQRAHILTALSESKASPTPRPLDAADVGATPLGPVDSTQPQDRDYDPRTHELGKLCAHGHNFRETGFSVRSLTGTHECRDCVAARQRKAREKKAGAGPG